MEARKKCHNLKNVHFEKNCPKIEKNYPKIEKPVFPL